MFNEKVYFEEVNGKQIFCDFSEPENLQKKIVLMSHGFRSSSVGPARTFVDFQRILNTEGYSVLRFDQPNSGNSEGKFWMEARNANFFECLKDYEGGIHLVYGEKDKFMSQEIINKVIDVVKDKNQPVMVLKGQDHSLWDFDIVQKVFREELDFLKRYL